MTALLQKALTAIEKLPETEQDWFGQRILDDMGGEEQRWDQLFAKSQDQLGQLAEAALSNFRSGKCRPMDEVLAKKPARPKTQRTRREASFA